MNDFFTPDSFAAFGSATLIVVVVVNVVRHLTGWGPRAFGLIVALLVAVVGAIVSGVFRSGESNLLQGLIVILNGALLYATAFGLQSTVVSRLGGRQGDSPARSPERPRFTTPW